MGFEFDAVKYRGSGSNVWTMGIWLDGDWKGHARKVGREGEWWPPYPLGMLVLDYYEPCRKAGEFRKMLAEHLELNVLLAENPNLRADIKALGNGRRLGKTLAEKIELAALLVENPRLRAHIKDFGGSLTLKELLEIGALDVYRYPRLMRYCEALGQ